MYKEIQNPVGPPTSIYAQFAKDRNLPTKDKFTVPLSTIQA